MRKRKMLSKTDVLQQMMALAAHPVNDAVRLAFLGEEARAEIAGLDLCGLAEFKRNANGTVEVKLIDRLAVLQTLLERVEEGEGDGALAFLQALEAPAVTASEACSQR